MFQLPKNPPQLALHSLTLRSQRSRRRRTVLRFAAETWAGPSLYRWSHCSGVHWISLVTGASWCFEGFFVCLFTVYFFQGPVGRLAFVLLEMFCRLFTNESHCVWLFIVVDPGVYIACWWVHGSFSFLTKCLSSQSSQEIWRPQIALLNHAQQRSGAKEMKITLKSNK